jgi:predicted PurR-regulated permease PerM
MASHSRASSGTAVALWILAVVAVLFFLRTAKALLIPIALAVLISYALEPIVAWLERHRIPRVAAASLVMLSILGATAGGAYSLREDAAQVVEAVPKAIQRAREMVQTQLGSDVGGIQETTTRVGTAGGRSDQDAAGSGETTGASEGMGSLVQRAISATFTLAGNLVVIFFLCSSSFFPVTTSGTGSSKSLVPTRNAAA